MFIVIEFDRIVIESRLNYDRMAECLS